MDTKLNLEKSHENLELQIKNRNDSISNLECELKANQETIKLLNESIHCKEIEINELKEELNEQLECKEDTQLKMSNRDAIISELKFDLQTLHKTITNHEEEKTSLLDELKTKQASLANLEKLLREKDELIILFKDEIQANNETIEDLKNIESEYRASQVDSSPFNSKNSISVEKPETILSLDSYRGGWPSLYMPRRSNPWFNKNIRPGTIREKSSSKTVKRAKSKMKTAISSLGYLKNINA